MILGSGLLHGGNYLESSSPRTHCHELTGELTWHANGGRGPGSSAASRPRVHSEWTSGAGHSGMVGSGLQFFRDRVPGQTGDILGFAFPFDTPITTLSRKKGEMPGKRTPNLKSM